LTIVNVTPTLARVSNTKTYIMTSFYSADASGAEVILAAHATKPHYVEELQITIHGDILVDFGDGETGSAVETKALQFIGTAEGVAHPPMDFKDNPLKLTAAKAIVIDASGAGPIAGYVKSYTVD